MALSALAVVLVVVAAATSWGQSRRLAAAGQRWRRVVALQADQDLAVQRLQTLADAQNVAEAAVHGTTVTVQAVHRGIASIPFGILEAIPVTREPAKVVRAIHDLTAQSVYGSIKAINRLVGRGLRGVSGPGKKK